MARRKKPENETVDESKRRMIFEYVSNASNRSEKTSWNRKMDNMVVLLSKLRPIEQEIVELSSQKVPIFDEVQVLRETMVKECVHPYQHLILNTDHVLCKFCNTKIRIPDDKFER